MSGTGPRRRDARRRFAQKAACSVSRNLSWIRQISGHSPWINAMRSVEGMAQSSPMDRRETD
jgi:hypothetical protein